MKKFSKRRAEFISDDADSLIATTVSTTPEPLLAYEGRITIEVVLTDCNRKICWHDFGDTEKEALKKVDKIIKQFSLFREDIVKGYEVIKND